MRGFRLSIMSTHAVTLTRSWYRSTYFHHQSGFTGGKGTYHNKQCISITLGKVPSIRVFCTFESWHQREKKASPSPLKVISVPLPVQSSPAPPLFPLHIQESRLWGFHWTNLFEVRSKWCCSESRMGSSLVMGVKETLLSTLQCCTSMHIYSLWYQKLKTNEW